MAVALRPIEETLACLAAASPELSDWVLPVPGSENGWHSLARLTAPGTPQLSQTLGRVAAHYGANDNRSPAALWFGRYAYAVAGLAAACYLLERRVPDLTTLEGVWVRLDEAGDLTGLALTNRSFTALAQDRAADHPDCVARHDLDRLRRQLREQIVDHLTPVVEAVRAKSSMGRPGLWALAADYCAQVFTWLGRQAGDEAAGLEEARRMARSRSPLSRKRDFIVIEHCGQTYPLVDRTSCCLYYKTTGGEYCSTCPHRSQDERVRLMKRWMEKRETAQVEA